MSEGIIVRRGGVSGGWESDYLVIPGVADAYVSVRGGDTNYGSSEYLNVLGYSGYETRSFVKFQDISSLMGETIARATLYVMYYSNDVSSRNQPHRIKRVTENWVEDTITWNNQPTFYGSGTLDGGSYGLLENDPDTTSTYCWRTLDITTLVQEWLDETYTNYGICIDHTYSTTVAGGTWASIRYRSKEYNTGSHIPHIIIKL